MHLIGLTGSIATGKSTTSQLLASPPYSLPIIDADVLARAAVEPGTWAYKQIVGTFGGSTPDLLLPASDPQSGGREDGPQGKGRPLNRPALGRRVFGQSAERTADRQRLNSIVHPAVRLYMLRSLAYYYVRGHWAVVLDIPLLFESGLDVFCSSVVVTDVALKAKWAQERGPGKGYVLYNDGKKADLEVQLNEVMGKISASSPRWWSALLLVFPPLMVSVASWQLLVNYLKHRRALRDRANPKANNSPYNNPAEYDRMAEDEDGEENVKRLLSTPILSLSLSLPPAPSSSTLIVRPYRASDAAAIAAAANSPAIACNMTNTFPSPYTLERAQSWIALQLDVDKTWKSTALPPSSSVYYYYPSLSSSVDIGSQGQDTTKRAPKRMPSNYVIVLDDEPVGGIGLKFGEDIESRSAEFGYWLSPACWGRGVMSVVATAFVAWTFDSFPYLVRLSAQVFSWNRASMRVCEKAGMQQEAVLKRLVWKDGRLGDMVVYSILRNTSDDKYEPFER
ncbi:hypothetical protein DV735_g1336, partial [Chaetothyriales sp. CBS 134920]